MDWQSQLFAKKAYGILNAHNGGGVMSNFNKNYYPDYAFPSIANAVIQEIAFETKAPVEMVANSVLASMALAVQGQYRVRRKEGLESPCSLAVVSICSSGERKTTVDKKTTKAFYDFESEKHEEYERRHLEYRTKKLMWDTERRAMTKRFEKAVESGESLESVAAKLMEHEAAEPKPPRRPRLVYKDVTSAALLHGLHANTRSASLNEDEASRFFHGPLSDDACLINKGWDGSDLTVDRKSVESFSVKSPRISLNLMVQPSAFAKYMERKGHDARGVGFIARWLVCYPATTQGNRFDNYLESPEPAAQEAFSRRIKELLQQQLDSGAFESSLSETVLTFAPDAQREWIAISNQIEASIRPGGAFCEASDYASKIAENIARIAGVFHAFSGHDGSQISIETLRSAANVASWYASEFIRLFSPPDPLDECVRDAIELESWFVRLVQKREWLNVEKGYVLKYGPNPLRARDRLNWALGCLSQEYRLTVQLMGKRKQVICLNPNFFLPAARGVMPIGFRRL